MRTATLLPVVALLAGAVNAAPLPNADASAEPTIWSWRCGLFGWRCHNHNQQPQPQPSAQPSVQPPQPSSQAPPQQSSQAPPQQSSQAPPQQSSQAPPQPSSQAPPQPSGSQAPPQPSGSQAPQPSGPAPPVNNCLTAEFCPDTGLGQGGQPPAGDGTATFPNGILAPEGDRQRRAEEARLD